MDPVRMDGAVVSEYGWLADAFNKNNESKEASNVQDNESLITLKTAGGKVVAFVRACAWFTKWNFYSYKRSINKSSSLSLASRRLFSPGVWKKDKRMARGRLSSADRDIVLWFSLQ